MEEDISNYSPTVMFHGTPCSSLAPTDNLPGPAELFHITILACAKVAMGHFVM